MVLGTTIGSRRGSALLQIREVTESIAESGPVEMSADAARALHERLVSYVRAVAGDAPRCGVWGEHSYARARDVPQQARELLATRPPPETELDVERLEPAPPPLEPAPDDDDALDDDGDAPDDWEARVAALAPGATHARLAVAAADILRRLRLARLAGHGSEATRAAARRLRLALAPVWVWPGAPQLRPAPWLNAALLAHLPRSLRSLYDDVLSQLRRASPRLTERLMLGRLPPAAEDPLGAVGPALGPDAAGPVLVWVGVGAASDARWLRRLSALLFVREVRAQPTGAPDVWCAQAAAALRADVQEIISEAGARGVVVMGCGGGAALAAQAGAGARGAVLLAPPLRTAEGGWARRSLPARALLVAGGGWRGPVLAAGDRGRRVLLVAGADERLRLPRHQRARLRLPQHALDAAIVEEVYRWVLEADEAGSETESPATSPARLEAEDEPPVAVIAARPSRSIEIVEGRVVTRGAGSTPLPLTRVSPSAADILHMPIVFADDDRTLPAPAPAPAPAPLTVTSGDPRGSTGGGPASGRVTRVLVAKRGRAPAAGLVLRRAD